MRRYSAGMNEPSGAETADSFVAGRRRRRATAKCVDCGTTHPVDSGYTVQPPEDEEKFFICAEDWSRRPNEVLEQRYPVLHTYAVPDGGRPIEPGLDGGVEEPEPQDQEEAPTLWANLVGKRVEISWTRKLTGQHRRTGTLTGFHWAGVEKATLFASLDDGLSINTAADDFKITELTELR